MSTEEYNKKLLNEEIERKILKSEEDYNNGRVRKAEDVFKEWELKYENLHLNTQTWNKGNVEKKLIKM